MKKPNRKDFPNNRNGSSRYNTAVRKYNTFVKNKNKPVNKDPRPKIGDFPNREAYRQSVLKWNERRKNRLKKERADKLKSEGKKNTSRGVRPITSGSKKNQKDLKVNKKESYAKDRVGKVDLNSKEYKEAKRINEQPVKYQTNQTSGKTSGIGPVKDGDKYAEKLKIRKDEANKKGNKKAEGATTTGGPVKSGVEYAKSKGDNLAGYRRQKDTRITKKLKKAGFTEDRLARLRKKNAAFQKAKKGGKKAMEEYRKKYPRRG